VAYSLEFEQVRVRSYLFNHPDLTRGDRVKLYTFLNDLRDLGDSFQADAGRRLRPGSPCFWVAFVFKDESGRLRQFRFIVHDAAAPYGVLRVVYADEM
jgi:hypothetical protein